VPLLVAGSKKNAFRGEIAANFHTGEMAICYVLILLFSCSLTSAITFPSEIAYT